MNQAIAKAIAKAKTIKAPVYIAATYSKIALTSKAPKFGNYYIAYASGLVIKHVIDFNDSGAFVKETIV
jgi:hypothetical protein